MHTKLSIPERLKDLRVVDKHLTLEQLAEQTGLSKSALSKYESDDYKDISPFAIATLAEFYGVSTDYLMGLSENKNHPNTELQTLHLSDDMVTLLSSGKINNRLLCEIATHENFQRLMTDIEIFVDRIADMRIAQMNLVLEATRQEVIRSHAPLCPYTGTWSGAGERLFQPHNPRRSGQYRSGYSSGPCHRPHHRRSAADFYRGQGKV